MGHLLKLFTLLLPPLNLFAMLFFFLYVIRVCQVQANMIVTAIYFAVLSLNTMPLYSLAVQMGGDYKGHLIPKRLAAHMSTVAQESEQVPTIMSPPSKLLSCTSLWGLLRCWFL